MVNKKIFLIGWFLCLGALLVFPKLFDKLQPQIIEKEIYRIKEVPKEIIKEIPIYKDRVIEKEKVVYQPTNVEIFIIKKLGEGDYIVKPNGKNETWFCSVYKEGNQDYIRFQKQ